MYKTDAHRMDFLKLEPKLQLLHFPRLRTELGNVGAPARFKRDKFPLYNDWRQTLQTLQDTERGLLPGRLHLPFLDHISGSNLIWFLKDVKDLRSFRHLITVMSGQKDKRRKRQTDKKL